MSRLDNFVMKNIKSFDKLPKRVREDIESSLKFRKSSIVSFVNRCESPIEQVLGVRLMDVEEHLYRQLSVIESFNYLHIMAQKEVIANSKKYRLDFLIECKIGDRIYYFAIECDGHDFHEKTKEQAARDKVRERNLMKEGYTVVRFTGSEIWRNPSKCTNEIIEIVNKAVDLDDYYEMLLRED